jgi:hypothetical protein
VQYNFYLKFYSYIDKVIGKSFDISQLNQFNATVGTKIVKTLNDSVSSFGFEELPSWAKMQNALIKLNLTWSNDPSTIGNQNKSDILAFWYTELASLVQSEQFISNELVVPDAQIEKASGIAHMNAYQDVFKMIFVYFFFCTALVMILLGVFRAMSIGLQDNLDMVMINVRVVLGLLLWLLGLLSLVGETVTGYIDSGFLLPTLLFVLVFGKFSYYVFPLDIILMRKVLVVLFEKGLTLFAIRHKRKFLLDCINSRKLGK